MPKLDVGQASLIYDGPTQSVYFRGGTYNPLSGTVLAPFYSPLTVDLDVAIIPNSYYVDAKGSWNTYGVSSSGGELKILDNWPTPVAHLSTNVFGLPVTTMQLAHVTAADVDLNVNVLGAVVDLTGQVQGNGDFDLKGTASLGFGGLTASASFDMQYTQATGFLFTATAQAQYSSSLVQAGLTLNFAFGVGSNGHLTYSGSGTASASVNTYLFGWKSFGSVGVGINNNEIWFEVDGISVDISLP
jgi:hypothetical protein